MLTLQLQSTVYEITVFRHAANCRATVSRAAVRYVLTSSQTLASRLR